MKTGHYKSWLTEAGFKLKLQYPKPTPGKYELLIQVPEWLQGDIDNRVKAVSDLLVAHQLVKDDRHAWRVIVERAKIDECNVQLKEV